MIRGRSRKDVMSIGHHERKRDHDEIENIYPMRLRYVGGSTFLQKGNNNRDSRRSLHQCRFCEFRFYLGGIDVEKDCDHGERTRSR